MEVFRLGLTGFLVLILPIVSVFWIVMHIGVAHWKDGPWRRPYYFAGGAIILVSIVVLWRLPFLVGADLGWNPVLFCLGVLVYLASLIPFRGIHRYLDFRTFAGVAEVKDDKTALLQEGPFQFVRHPRYLTVLIGCIGWSIAANYAGAYVFSAIFFLVLLFIIRLEERELINRFGDEYRLYQTKTPMLLPYLKALTTQTKSTAHEK